MDTKMKFNDFYYSILNDYLDNKPNDLKIEEWRDIYYINIPALSIILLHNIELDSKSIPKYLKNKIENHIKKYNSNNSEKLLDYKCWHNKDYSYTITIAQYG